MFDPSDKIIGGCEQHEAELDARADKLANCKPVYYCNWCQKDYDEYITNEDGDAVCAVCGELIEDVTAERNGL